MQNIIRRLFVQHGGSDLSHISATQITFFGRPSGDSRTRNENQEGQLTTPCLSVLALPSSPLPRSQEQELADSSGNSVALFISITSINSNLFLQQEGASSNKMEHSLSSCYSIAPGEEWEGAEQAQPQRPGCLRDRRRQLLFQFRHGPKFF